MILEITSFADIFICQIQIMQEIVEKKDSLQSWIVCLVSLGVNLFVGGVASSFGIIVPSLQTYYDENASLVSFAPQESEPLLLSVLS